LPFSTFSVVGTAVLIDQLERSADRRRGGRGLEDAGPIGEAAGDDHGDQAGQNQDDAMTKHVRFHLWLSPDA
jgi:hypothetical protein